MSFYRTRLNRFCEAFNSRDLATLTPLKIDEHLAAIGMPVNYTNVFWGGRSEIKPSEISPVVYREWCKKLGVDAERMKS